MSTRVSALALAATLVVAPTYADAHGSGRGGGGGWHGGGGGWHGGGTCGWCWAGFGLGVLGLGALYAAPYAYAPPPPVILRAPATRPTTRRRPTTSSRLPTGIRRRPATTHAPHY